MKYSILLTTVLFSLTSLAETVQVAPVESVAPVVVIQPTEPGNLDWTSGRLTCEGVTYVLNEDKTVSLELENNAVILDPVDFKSWSAERNQLNFEGAEVMIIINGVSSDEFRFETHEKVSMGVVITADMYNNNLLADSVQIATTSFVPRTQSFQTSSRPLATFCDFIAD